MTGNASHADFDRGEDVNLDEVAPYGNEEPMGGDDDAAQDSDEDEGSLYMPTLIQKREPKPKAAKKSAGPPAPIPKAPQFKPMASLEQPEGGGPGGI